MGTKTNPGEYDCYEKAADDEPMFVLLARDPYAPLLVRLWSTLRLMHAERSPKGNKERRKTAEAQRCALAMEEWAKAHPPDCDD